MKCALLHFLFFFFVLVSKFESYNIQLLAIVLKPIKTYFSMLCDNLSFAIVHDFHQCCEIERYNCVQAMANFVRPISRSIASLYLWFRFRGKCRIIENLPGNSNAAKWKINTDFRLWNANDVYSVFMVHTWIQRHIFSRHFNIALLFGNLKIYTLQSILQFHSATHTHTPNLRIIV